MKLKLSLLLAVIAWQPIFSIAYAQNVITTVAGNGIGGYAGDGGMATDATIHDALKIFVDTHSNLFIADGLYNNVVRKVDGATGIITTIAGNGTIGTTGNGGPATAAQLNWPYAVYVNTAGDIFITESTGNVIRKIDAATGIISTIAGNGLSGYSGDGGPATNAALWVPSGICGDAAGNLYFTEYGSSTVRKISSAGIITTLAGTGLAGTSADGVPATSAQLEHPEGVFVDNSGNIYISDRTNRIRKVIAATGIITTVAGNGTNGYSGDGSPATTAQLNGPFDVSVTPSGDIYIADGGNNVIRKVTAAGTISTIAGTGTSGYSGDGGAATDAQMYTPSGISVLPSGDLYIADAGNNVIRKVAPIPSAVNNVNGVMPGIYPNPSKQELAISGITQPISYKILDIAGINIQQGMFQNRGNTIAIHNIPNGMYLLEVTDKTGNKSIMKFAKQ